MTSTGKAQGMLDTPLDEVVRNFPTILERLRTSYGELEARAVHVERELYRANRELERKVEELDGLRRHLEAVLQSLPCGVVVRDASGAIVQLNTKAQELLGIEDGQTTPRATGSSGEGNALRGELADGRPHEVLHPDGRRLWISSSYSPVRRRSGALDGSVEILDDQTERVEMTARLHAADKMAALGTMATGIAHEIRNPLSAVKGFAVLMERREETAPTLARWCRLIAEATDEANAIIENMLSLGSSQHLLLESIDGSELLEDAARLARPETDGTDVTIRTRSDAPRFVADGIKLRQAVRNLIANAVDVQLARPVPGRDGVRVDVELRREQDTLRVSVADAGPGVAPEIRDRIFDPFFTDHPDGTGLGLALVSTLVRLHGGTVRVSSEPSHLGGADFHFQIPFRPAESGAESPTCQER